MEEMICIICCHPPPALTCVAFIDFITKIWWVCIACDVQCCVEQLVIVYLFVDNALKKIIIIYEHNTIR